MAILGMAVYSTAENKKDEYLEKTLYSLYRSVNFKVHRLILSVNAKTDLTENIIQAYKDVGVISEVIYNDSNIGTAEAINKAWRLGVPEENKLKMDDDVVIHQEGWLDLLEEAIRRDPEIGIVGCKRKDCDESPDSKIPQYKSELYMLPHQKGERWIIGEKVQHVMGTCQLYSAALLEKIGYLWQMGQYGFDDSIAAVRCKLAGFKSVFIPSIEIDHIDPGGTEYTKWKEEVSGEKLRWMPGTNITEYGQVLNDYHFGRKSIYYNPFN